MEDSTVPIVSKAGLYFSGVSALCWGVSVLKRHEAARIEAAKPIQSLFGDSPHAHPLLVCYQGKVPQPEHSPSCLKSVQTCGAQQTLCRCSCECRGRHGARNRSSASCCHHEKQSSRMCVRVV